MVLGLSCSFFQRVFWSLTITILTHPFLRSEKGAHLDPYIAFAWVIQLYSLSGVPLSAPHPRHLAAGAGVPVALSAGTEERGSGTRVPPGPDLATLEPWIGRVD